MATNTVSEYFTDEELCSQLRMQYDLDEMWRIDFMSLLSQVVDIGECFELKIKGRVFNINKITGGVSEVKTNE